MLEWSLGWDYFFKCLGIIGAVIFFGRFYIQWLWSEKLGRSVVPLIFWYMSSIGSIFLLSYGVYILSAVGVVSYGFNLLVYVRNLIHIWRRDGKLTKFRYYFSHGLVGIAFIIASIVVCYVWYEKFFHVREMSRHTAIQHSLWIFLGVVGQFFFALRFLVQWLATEFSRKSVVPKAFWYLSIIASLLQIISYSMLKEWLYAIGLTSTLFIYFRNIWLINKGKTPVPIGNGEN